MKDVLKNLIVEKIKGNSNQEITGQSLQDVLLSIVDSVYGDLEISMEGYLFEGIATIATIPPTLASDSDKRFYLAVDDGIYSNFTGLQSTPIVELSILRSTSRNYWEAISLKIPLNFSIKNELGTSQKDPISQKKVTELYNQGYKYVGIAHTVDRPNPLTGEEKIFMLVTEEGDYTNYGLGTISELSVIKSLSGSWVVEGLGVDLLSRAAIENHKNIESLRLFPNLFNSETVAPDTYLNSDGTTYDRTGYSTSDYVPILPNKEYIFFRANVGVAFYDINLKFVSFTNIPTGSETATSPTNAYYARITYYTSWANSNNIYVGLPPKNFNRQFGTEEIADEAITTDKIAGMAITTEKIADKAITAEKTPFFTPGKNLCDSESPDFIRGKYLGSNGGMASSTSAFITPYIRFTQEMGKLIVSANGAMVTGGYQHCVYDSNLNFIKAYSANLGAVPWEEGVAYIRFSGGNSGVNVQVEIGEVVTSYEPFSAHLKDEYLDFEKIKEEIEENLSVPGLEVTLPAQSTVGQDGISAYLESINAGNTYTISEYPKYLKKTGVMAAYMNFSGVFDGYIDVGFFGTPSIVGDNTTYGLGIYVRVTGSNYQILVRGSSYTTQDHNLAIDKFLNVSYSRDTDGSIHVILATLGGIYVSEALNINAPIESYQQPSIYTSAINLTGVKLNVYNRDFRKPIWVVGDSYVSLYKERWTYQMQVTMGIKNWLLQGLAGGTSTTMLQDLKRSLALGTPKFLMWCPGMNDTYELWLSALEELKTICQEKGIELILTTIPTVPTHNKEEITQYVRSSGYRYIDFYEALGATPEGVWYDGYLEENQDPSKRVHTTELGAKIQAARVLVDFPEIIDFNA